MDVHTPCPSSSNSALQANTTTHARNIIPFEDTDPFHVVDGGMESWTSDSFVLVVSAARTPLNANPLISQGRRR